MNVSTGVTVALAAVAVGVSACATDNSVAAPSTTTTIATAASATTVTSVSTVTSASSATSTATSTPTPTGSSATTTSATETTGAPMVGGMTECTKEALAQPAMQAAQAMGADNVYTVDNLNCADGWAVTGGVLAGKENPQMGAPTSFVFQQEGQFWVLQDKSKVCGTNPTTTTAPADAAIPAALFLAGCAAG